MNFEYDGKTLRFDKELSDLDKLVIDFVSLLEDAKLKYVIVSGYVAILFGRSRTTEDIDIFIGKVGSEDFRRFFGLLGKNEYWLIDSDSMEDALDRLQNGLSVRVAKKDNIVPNFEIKFAKKKTDFLSLNKPLEVLLNKKRLFVSPLEVQIPFKIWLGGDKDIEDALHTYEIFKNELNKELMKETAKELKVEGDMIKHGII